MSEWTKRQKALLNELDEKIPISGKELAARLGVSPRTVRNEICNINELQPDLILAIKSKGYIRNKNLEATEDNEILSEENMERQFDILKRLMKEDLNLYDLADELFISETKLLKDIRQINEIISLRNPDVSIERANNVLHLKGTSQGRSQVAVSFLLRELDAYDFNLDNYQEFFDTFYIQDLKQMVLEFIRSHDLGMKDMEVISFIMHVTILTDRLMQGIHSQSLEVESFDRGLAEDFASCLQEQFGVEPNEDDIEYIACLFSNKTSVKGIRNASQMSEYTSQLLSEVKEEFEVDLLEDQVLIQNLQLHFMALQNRLMSGSFLNNPLIQDIRTHFPRIHDIAIFMAYRIEQYTGKKLTEEEIGYLTLHLMGAIERMKKDPDYKVVIISPIGESLNGYLRNRLNLITEFEIELFGILSVYDLDLLQSLQPDLVISLFPLTQEISYPLYICKNMLSDEDLENIRELLRKQKSHQALSGFFEEQLFFAHQDFRTKDEIIHFLCTKLHEAGYTDSDYEILIQKRESLAPTAFGGGFAIPHPVKRQARINKIAVCTLNNSVTWNEDKVRLVFLLALSPAKDKDFDELFERLVNLMDSRQKVRQMSRADDLDTFLNLFEQE